MFMNKSFLQHDGVASRFTEDRRWMYEPGYSVRGLQFEERTLKGLEPESLGQARCRRWMQGVSLAAVGLFVGLGVYVWVKGGGL
jgi:hypothetical protein